MEDKKERFETDNRIIKASNMIFRKEYAAAITLLNSLSDESLSQIDRQMKHINLVQVYFKTKQIPECNHHCRKAIEYGHATGLAYERLAINLEKTGEVEEAISVIKQAIANPNVPSKHSYLTNSALEKRLERLRRKLEKTKKKKK